MESRHIRTRLYDNIPYRTNALKPLCFFSWLYLDRMTFLAPIYCLQANTKCSERFLFHTHHVISQTSTLVERRTTHPFSSSTCHILSTGIASIGYSGRRQIAKLITVCFENRKIQHSIGRIALKNIYMQNQSLSIGCQVNFVSVILLGIYSEITGPSRNYQNLRSAKATRSTTTSEDFIGASSYEKQMLTVVGPWLCQFFLLIKQVSTQ